ncbi:hypothetical protein KKF32_02340 [Patescibacteria group bacterium]|nr:hypothetical protein [Patescibacteria group bacterium]
MSPWGQTPPPPPSGPGTPPPPPPPPGTEPTYEPNHSEIMVALQRIEERLERIERLFQKG